MENICVSILIYSGNYFICTECADLLHITCSKCVEMYQSVERKVLKGAPLTFDFRMYIEKAEPTRVKKQIVLLVSFILFSFTLILPCCSPLLQNMKHRNVSKCRGCEHWDYLSQWYQISATGFFHDLFCSSQQAHRKARMQIYSLTLISIFRACNLGLIL